MSCCKTPLRVPTSGTRLPNGTHPVACGRAAVYHGQHAKRGSSQRCFPGDPSLPILVGQGWFYRYMDGQLLHYTLNQSGGCL